MTQLRSKNFSCTRRDARFAPVRTNGHQSSRAYIDAYLHTQAIPQPEAYQETGYYPTNYVIAYSPSDYSVTVAMENFVYQTATSAEPQPEAALPADFILLSSYPNPFNPQTTVQYILPQQGYVTLKVYNLVGEEVATLVDGTRAAGTHTASFDATGLSSGLYLARLQAGNTSAFSKMLLVR